MAKRESVYKVTLTVLIPFDVRDFDSVVEAANLVKGLRDGKATNGIKPWRFAARKTSREILDAQAAAEDGARADIEDAIDSQDDEEDAGDDAVLDALDGAVDDDPSKFDPDAVPVQEPVKRTRQAKSAA